MINPIAALRAYMALNQVAVQVKSVPKPGVYSTEFWTAIFGILMVAYEGSKGVVPPQYSVYLMLGMSALYILVRFALKLKHLELPPVRQLENPAVEAFLADMLAQANAAAAASKAAAADVKAKTQADVDATKAADNMTPLP